MSQTYEQRLRAHRLETMRDELKEFAERIGRMNAELDREVTTCDCCGRQSWVSRDEFQLAREMEATAERLRRHADFVNGIIAKEGG